MNRHPRAAVRDKPESTRADFTCIWYVSRGWQTSKCHSLNTRLLGHSADMLSIAWLFCHLSSCSRCSSRHSFKVHDDHDIEGSWKGGSEGRTGGRNWDMENGLGAREVAGTETQVITQPTRCASNHGDGN